MRKARATTHCWFVAPRPVAPHARRAGKVNSVNRTRKFGANRLDRELNCNFILQINYMVLVLSKIEFTKQLKQHKIKSGDLLLFNRLIKSN